MDEWLRIDVSIALGSGPLLAKLAASRPAVGIVGPSGSGKTTLLRVVAGVEQRVAGTLVGFGETWWGPAERVPAWKRGCAWVPQDALLFPHLSVGQNLCFAGDAGKDEVIELLQVAPLLSRAPRHLSGGERQRVAIGRALLSGRRAILLDEPFSALDKPFRRRLADGIAAYCQARGTNVVIVSHDEADLAAFGADCWRVEDGVVRAGHQAATLAPSGF